MAALLKCMRKTIRFSLTVNNTSIFDKGQRIMKFSKLMAFALLAAWPALAWSQEAERETKKEIRLH